MTCKVCGCTDEQACVWFEVLGDGRSIERRCSWAAPSLCSECAAAPVPAYFRDGKLTVDDDVEAPRPLLYDAHGAPLVFADAPGPPCMLCHVPGCGMTCSIP